MMSSENAVSSYNGLIPSETVYEKRRGLLRSIARKENLISILRQLLSSPVLYGIWSTPTNFTVICKPMNNLLKKLDNPEISSIYTASKFQGH